MAGRLNIIGDVATEGDVPDLLRVQVIVRDNKATISRVGDVLLERDQVVAVEQVQSRSWLIRFQDGSAWAAKVPDRRAGGCGCK